MKKALLAVTVAALCLEVANPSFAQDKPPSWNIGQMKCSEIVEPDTTNFKPMIEYYFYWLNGYINGLKGASVLDKRLKAMSVFSEEDVRAAVMTYCSKNPDMSLIQATTGVAEFMINVSGPGKTLNLNWR